MRDAAVGDAASPKEQVCTADVIASLCLATDLGMGFPFEHGLSATLTTMWLCRAMGVDAETAQVTHHVSLLMYSGCTVDAGERARLFGDSLTPHHIHRQHGSQVESLVGIAGALPSADAPWPVRAYQVATRLPKARSFAVRHVVAFCEVAGMLADRLGLPPAVEAVFPYLSERWDGNGMLGRAQGEEVPLPLRITHVGRDATYQRLVADDAQVVETIRSRSGHAFDPGVVDAFVSDAADVLGPREPDESAWDAVLAAEPGLPMRLADTQVDRALWAMGAFADTASPDLTGHSAAVGELAGRAAEVVDMSKPEDASGYHRGVDASVLSREQRLLAAADQEPPQVRRPAGLAEREVQVFGLLARGGATKQIAANLGIATKTADRHIQNIYATIGVSSRAAAALYAVEHALAERGLPFLVVDANARTGDAWRNRWDSLTLVTPNWANGLPGMPFPGEPWDFPTKDEVGDYLEAYAGYFELPIRHGTRIDRSTRVDGQFLATAGDTTFVADTVVVAMAAPGRRSRWSSCGTTRCWCRVRAPAPSRSASVDSVAAS